MNSNFNPYNFGEFADAAIVQANHVEYKTITTLDSPQIRTLPDGRNILSQIQFQQIKVISLDARICNSDSKEQFDQRNYSYASRCNY